MTGGQSEVHRTGRNYTEGPLRLRNREGHIPSGLTAPRLKRLLLVH
jgi:hypothetical protein